MEIFEKNCLPRYSLNACAIPGGNAQATAYPDPMIDNQSDNWAHRAAYGIEHLTIFAQRRIAHDG